MLDKILLWIVFACGVICYLTSCFAFSRHFIHMFQLNSYKPKVQLAWLNKNSKKYFIIGIVGIAIAHISLIFDTVIPSYAFVSAAASFMNACGITHKSRKTPLAVTARVKRLCVTLGILLLLPALLILGGVEFLLRWLPYALIIIVTLIPYIILLANLINRPVELAINRHYINDAKKIIGGCKNLRVIGITGSFGKTSVKYFLDSLLSVKYNVLKTPGNFNTTLGVVRTIRGSLRATHEIFLCEMGAKNIGDIKEICDLVHPEMGIITSVGPMHLESFKSMENVTKTKFELADASKILFANFDNEYIAEECKKRKAIPYGVDSHEGYYVSELHVSERGSEFKITAPSGESCDYRTRLIGRHNVLNICGAIAVANTMGITLEELKPAVRKLESVPHRLELIDKGGYTVIDDAYNSNPSGTKAALEALSMCDGMKILVTPGMIELGEMEYQLNKEFGGNAAAICDYVALVGKKQTQPIYDGLVEAGYPEEKIYVADSLNDAMSKVYSLTSDGKRKIILLENDLPDNY